MTWSKYGSEFWEELAAEELSDAAVRTHGEVIGWLYNVDRPSCLIPKSKVYKVTNSPDNHRAVRELVRSGMWVEHETSFEVLHHAEVLRQSLAAQSAKKDRDAKAQQAKRDRAKKQAVSADVAADVSGDTDRQADSREVTSEMYASAEPWESLRGPVVWRVSGETLA